MRVPHTFHLRCCASFIFYFFFLGFGLFHKVSSVSNRNGYPPDLLRRPRSIKKKNQLGTFQQQDNSIHKPLHHQLCRWSRGESLWTMPSRPTVRVNYELLIIAPDFEPMFRRVLCTGSLDKGIALKRSSWTSPARFIGDAVGAENARNSRRVSIFFCSMHRSERLDRKAISSYSNRGPLLSRQARFPLDDFLFGFFHQLCSSSVLMSPDFTIEKRIPSFSYLVYTFLSLYQYTSLVFIKFLSSFISSSSRPDLTDLDHFHPIELKFKLISLGFVVTATNSYRLYELWRYYEKIRLYSFVNEGRHFFIEKKQNVAKPKCSKNNITNQLICKPEFSNGSFLFGILTSLRKKTIGNRILSENGRSFKLKVSVQQGTYWSGVVFVVIHFRLFVFFCLSFSGSPWSRCSTSTVSTWPFGLTSIPTRDSGSLLWYQHLPIVFVVAAVVVVVVVVVVIPGFPWTLWYSGRPPEYELVLLGFPGSTGSLWQIVADFSLWSTFLLGTDAKARLQPDRGQRQLGGAVRQSASSSPRHHGIGRLSRGKGIGKINKKKHHRTLPIGVQNDQNRGVQ